MHTYELQVKSGRFFARAIRWELFVFDDILDVVASSRSDSVVVVFQGRPCPAEWIRTLRAAGYTCVDPVTSLAA